MSPGMKIETEIAYIYTCVWQSSLFLKSLYDFYHIDDACQQFDLGYVYFKIKYQLLIFRLYAYVILNCDIFNFNFPLY